MGEDTSVTPFVALALWSPRPCKRGDIRTDRQTDEHCHCI